MRRRLFLALASLVVLFAAGALVTHYQLRSVTEEFVHLLDLHQVEQLRLDLVIAIQTTLADLYTSDTGVAPTADAVSARILQLDATMRSCSGCHHSQAIAADFERVEKALARYQEGLSFYLTSSESAARRNRLFVETSLIGNEALALTQRMSRRAGGLLRARTDAATTRVRRLRGLLSGVALLALGLLIVATTRLATSINTPIQQLVEATRAIAAGDLEHRLQMVRRDEFGELATHFNAMGRALSGSYADLQAKIRDLDEAQRALKVSEERYALAAAGANDGLWDWDLRTNQVFFSARWNSMLQLDSHETVAGPDVWLGRVHAEDRVALEAKISSHIAGTSPDLQHEYRIRRSDDTYIWVHCRGAAVRGPKGAAYRLAGSQADITARKRAEEQLVFDAFHDALTGLPNRLLFLDRLGQVLRSFRRGDETWAVLFLDLDRFKVVNDSLGHATGDRLLGKVGGRLLQCVRPSDTVARLGGDEFGILLPEVGALADAIQVADRIETELRRSFTIDGNEVFATASIGIALRSDRYEKAEQVLRDADIAMYQAKAKSKARNSGRYEVFNAEMHGSVLERLALEAHLRRAVEHGQEEFFLEYQPIIDLANGDVIAFEALARWNLPAIGTVPPREFIALAEESGMIAQLGDWILRSAAEQLGLWLPHRGAFERVGISLNMSAHLFREADIVERIAGILAAADVAAERIVVEVTESILLDDADAAVQKLTALRDMGMQIHVDDFGTGYSSLSYLQRFPVTGVKIDRSFVSALVDRPESEALVRAILSLSETLRLTVVAEGIETAAQYARLRELGCAQGQGFHIGMPMAPQQALAWTLSRLRAEAPI